MLDAQIKQRPDLAPYRNVIKTFFERYMSYDVLKPDIISLYEAEFTAKELKEVRRFYQTSAGRKVIQKMPLLLRQSADIGSKRAQAHIADLQKMIQEETDRISKAKQP